MTETTTSSEKPVSDPAMGILRPHLKHEFRVHVAGPSDEIRDQIAMQIISVRLDYRTKTAKLVLEQPLAAGALHQFINEWVNGKPSMSVIALDSRENAYYIIRLNRMKCVNHEFVLDYAESDAAHHKLTFVFETLTMGDPKQSRNKGVQGGVVAS